MVAQMFVFGVIGTWLSQPFIDELAQLGIPIPQMA
jgi:hypothetical protein